MARKAHDEKGAHEERPTLNKLEPGAEFDSSSTPLEEESLPPVLEVESEIIVEEEPDPKVEPIPPVVVPPSPPGKARYRVWPHGDLHRNGKVYKPGDELILHEEEAANIVCLEQVK